MKIIADTHCHTIASTHAYSTLMENIKVAKQKGLYAIATTDHGPTMPGAPGKWFFRNLRTIPRYVDSVMVIRGVEANVINSNGDLDLDLEFEHSTLDWVVASVHPPTYVDKSHTIDDMTKAYLNLAKNPIVNVIGHSGSEEFKYDYEKVIPEFKKNGKLVEINNHTFIGRKSSVENCKTIAKICKKYSAPIIINSDAHFCEFVGNYENAANLLKEIDFPEELIVNTNIERFKKYLNKYTNIFSKE